MLFSEIVTHNLSKSPPERLRARKVVGPYRWTPADPGKVKGFYLASYSGRGFPHRPETDPHGSPFRLRLHWGEADRFGTPDGWYYDDLEPWYGIVAALPARKGQAPRWLAGATMGPGMCAFLDRLTYATREDATREAERLAREAAFQDWADAPDDEEEDA